MSNDKKPGRVPGFFLAGSSLLKLMRAAISFPWRGSTWNNPCTMRKPKLLLIAAACLISSFAVAAAQTLRYTILMNDQKSGAEVDTFSADGKLDSTFEFNDR